MQPFKRFSIDCPARTYALRACRYQLRAINMPSSCRLTNGLNCKKIYPNIGLADVRFRVEFEIVKKMPKRRWKGLIRGRALWIGQEVGRG